MVSELLLELFSNSLLLPAMTRLRLAVAMASSSLLTSSRHGTLKTKDIGCKLMHKGLESVDALVECAVLGGRGMDIVMSIRAVFAGVGTVKTVIANAAWAGSACLVRVRVLSGCVVTFDRHF
jgi:hypothetical protein